MRRSALLDFPPRPSKMESTCSSMSLPPIDPATTALVLIDLQNGIAGLPTSPRSGADVVRNCARLADRFRERGGLVILVRVAFAPDRKDALSVPTDQSFAPRNVTAGWSEIVPELGPREGDLVITKRQWGAFYGTDLELQLRRRGIRTLVLGGISTNSGVESTARAAYELGFAQVLVEDGMSAMQAEAHQATIRFVFPRLGNVRSADDVLQALA